MGEEQQIVIHSGHIDNEIVENLLSSVKSEFQRMDLLTLYKKKVYAIVVECLENMHRHCDRICNTTSSDNCVTAFEITRFDNAIVIACKNSILNKNIPKLKERLDYVNNLSRSQIKSFYKETILNANITEKGGAGLGIIDMRKTSGNKLIYSFEPIDTLFSIFKFVVKISFYKMNGMDAKIIQPTEKSPKVTFDPANRLFEMEGDSRPENVRKFYQPIIDMLKAYFDQLASDGKFGDYTEDPFKINFKLGYFNSSSAKFILDVLTILNDYRLEGLTLKINWYFEEDDEDMQEAGEEFSNFIDHPFNYIMVKE